MKADFYRVHAGTVEDEVGGSSMSDLREDRRFFPTLVDEEAIDWYFSRERSALESDKPRYVLAIYQGRQFLLDYDLDMEINDSGADHPNYEPWIVV